VSQTYAFECQTLQCITIRCQSKYDEEVGTEIVFLAYEFRPVTFDINNLNDIKKVKC